MPPRKQFSKDQIVEAAFEIATTEGMSGLTVRKVADKLGCSVAPIYVNFDGVDDLKRAVVQRVFDLGRRMMRQHYTGHQFLDIGIASVRFAREYSVLFRELVLTPNEYMDDYEQMLGDDVLGEITVDPALDGLTEQEVMVIFLKMRVFQLGLSAMVANGLLPPEFDEESEIKLLASTGEDIMLAARMRKDGRLGDES